MGMGEVFPGLGDLANLVATPESRSLGLSLLLILAPGETLAAWMRNGRHDLASGRTLRILMIAPTPFFAHRGCHVRILEEIRTLAAAGHDIALCTYGLGEDVPGVRTVRSVHVPWYRKLSAGPSWHKFYLDALLFLTALRFARRFRPDVLHAHLHEGTFVAAPLARWLGIPLLADLQGSLATELSDHGFFRRWRWGTWLFARLERSIDRIPKEIVVSTPSLVDDLRAARGDDGSISLVGDGVDSREFRPNPEARSAARAELGFGDENIVIAFLGLLTHYQGADLLLEAAVKVAARVPQARFLIMGFPDEDAYRTRAIALGLGDRVLFTGRVPYPQTPALLTAADVAVSPKRSTTEGNGKLLNYMAVGLPTVAFDTPINRSILGEGGVYARCNDVDDLARRLIDVATQPALRSRLSRELRHRAIAEFSWEMRARELEAVYARMIPRSGPSGEGGHLAGIREVAR